MPKWTFNAVLSGGNSYSNKVGSGLKLGEALEYALNKFWAFARHKCLKPLLNIIQVDFFNRKAFNKVFYFSLSEKDFICNILYM